MRTVHLSTATGNIAPSWFGGGLQLAEIPYGCATDKIPSDDQRVYASRVHGQVNVALPGGFVSHAPAFEALSVAEVPHEHYTLAELDNEMYWFHCSEAQASRGDRPCYRAYFSYRGKWLFFYTHGDRLPFNAMIHYLQPVS
ncbi:hypothetical protein PTKU46_36350 [Paraburkholderia terrae]|uniref:hypothetical protein n=1 Tax=Paraburkholderia terrae TaxID=311230 RepID=UPI0030E1AA9D